MWINGDTATLNFDLFLLIVMAPNIIVVVTTLSLLYLTNADNGMFSILDLYNQLSAIVSAKGSPKGIPFRKYIPSPKCLNDRIGIVGAGPAGIHMAYLLKKKGFNNVVVLEKSKPIGGKSYKVNYRNDPN